MEISPKNCQLSFLKDKRLVKSLLKNNKKKTAKIKIGTDEPLTDDFTPWWNDFGKFKSLLKIRKATPHKTTAKIQIGIDGPLADDFTPWWTDFGKSNSAKPITAQSTSQTDPDSYDSWFSQPGSSSMGQSTTKTTSGAIKHKVIEDIPVPSIYDYKPCTKGPRALKRARKEEREKTLGKKWFGMKAPDKDDPARQDMELIRMRAALDNKHFFKRNDMRATPKYFQMGTVVDDGTDYYSSRLTKKQRKSTLVDELMADASIRQHNKKEYIKLQEKMRDKKRGRKRHKKGGKKEEVKWV